MEIKLINNKNKIHVFNGTFAFQPPFISLILLLPKW